HQEFTKCEKANLAACIECGACSFVCPSKIDLVQHYRSAKAQITQLAQKKAAAEIAKARFEARQTRLEQEKRQREQHNLALQQASKPASEAAAANNQAAVAAAIARVKARQLQAKNEQSQKEPQENTSFAKSAPTSLAPLSGEKEQALATADVAATAQNAVSSKALLEPAKQAPVPAVKIDGAKTDAQKIGVAPAQTVKVAKFSTLRLQTKPAQSNSKLAAQNGNQQDGAQLSPTQPQEDN
ncbi:MAG: hypothetical protein ACRC9R_04035, partial [Enterovibrio sp.]